VNGKKSKKLRKVARAIAFANKKPISEIVTIYKKLKTLKSK